MFKMKKIIIELLKNHLKDSHNVYMDSLGNIIFFHEGKNYKINLSETLDHHSIY